jgi:hypothetical protein
MAEPEPGIIGHDAPVEKRAADASARWRIDPIEGLAFRPVRLVPQDGSEAALDRYRRNRR